MDRRDVLKAFMALPAVKSVEVAKLKSDDVIVIESSEKLSENTLYLIEENVSRIWPGRKVLVLDQGLSLKVVKGERAPTPSRGSFEDVLPDA